MSFLFKKINSSVQGVRETINTEIQENVTDVFAGEGINVEGRYAKEKKQVMSQIDYQDMLKGRDDRIVWTYCIVFPAKVPEVKTGVQGFVMSKLTKNYGKTADQLVIEREKIVTALKEASFEVQLFYSTNKEQIICKVGSTDARFLQVAEANDYLLRLSEYSVKKVLESSDVLPNGDKRLPIYLDYPYNDEELKAKLLPKFKVISSLGSTSVSMSTVASKVREQSRMSPFSKLHVKYNPKAEERIVKEHGVEIYKIYGDSILRTYDRIKLTQMSIESPRVAIKGNKGAGLDLKKLQFDGIIEAAYPVSFNETIAESKELTVDQLYDKWNTTFHKPWSQPIDDIRDYCGEKIALYFAFLGFYTLWLIPAALVGLAVFIHQLFELYDKAGTYNFVTANTDVLIANIPGSNLTFIEPIRPTEVPELPFYALFIALWGTFLLEFWKRRESTLALNWGTSNYERQAVVRPEFLPSYVLPNVVTGLPELYRSPLWFGLKLSVSFATVLTFVAAVIAAIFGTLVFKETVSQLGLPESIAPQVALVVNAILIIILGQAFRSVAKSLTDWENHRTDVEYEDSLIAKTFLFSFFNSYSTLMYYAFLKSGNKVYPDGRVQYCIPALQILADSANSTFTLEELKAADSCYGAVGYSLFILFGVQIFVSNSIEVGLPFVKSLFKSYTNGAKRRARQIAHAGESLVHREPSEEKEEEPTDAYDDEKLRERLMSPAEQQFILQQYETPFDDYLEIALQFGYVTLFVSAFPLAPVFALLACYVEFRVDSTKICFLSRKPDLSSAQDIGTWQSIFTILSFISVVVNSGLLLFTVKEPIVVDAPYDSSLRVWLFVIFIAFVYCIKLFADYFIQDVPGAVKIQLERQEHIERKIFDLEPDEDHETADVQDASSKEDSAEKKDEDYLKNQTPIDKFDPLIDYMIVHTREILKKDGLDREGMLQMSAKLFQEADLNKNKELSLNELRKMLRDPRYGAPLQSMSKFEVKLLMNAMDVNGDGAITQDEFNKFMFGPKGV